MARVGAKAMLLKPMLGNPSGAIGYVFNEYQDYDYPDSMGVQIIFPNGNYDGFSVKEQEQYLQFLGYVWEYTGYKFKNVLQVEIDFRKRYWRF